MTQLKCLMLALHLLENHILNGIIRGKKLLNILFKEFNPTLIVMVQIQFPTYDHIDQIRSLNSKYLITHLTEVQKQNGFIRIEYNNNDLQKIIDHREIVIATNNNIVVGYYLVGRKSENPLLDYQKDKAITLFDTNEIPFEKIGYGTQVCIDEDYREIGLSRLLIMALLEAIKDKYTHLLSSISKENKVSLKNSTAVGWRPLDTDEKPLFYIII